MSLWSRIRGKPKDPDLVTPGVERLALNIVVKGYRMALARQRWRYIRKLTYTARPDEQLRKLIRRGGTVLIRGKKRTGKTNAALVLYEVVEKHFKTTLIHNNQGIHTGHFVNNWEEFDRVFDQLKTEGYELIVVLLDDVSRCFKARRSGARRTDKLRDVFVEGAKKKFFLIGVEHIEKTGDIDFRRFADFVIEKPLKIKPGKDADVPLKAKRKLDCYWEGTLIWWTDKLPMSEIEYDPVFPGEWEDTNSKGKRVKIEPVYGSLKVKERSQESREDLFQALTTHLPKYMDAHLVQLFIDWLAGESLRTIQARTGVPASSLSDKFTELRENGLGYAFEDAYAEIYPEYQHIGGNTTEPDFIDEANKLVISTKCYCDPKINLKTAVNNIAQSEKALLTQGYRLQLHIFEAFSHVLYVYDCTRVRGGP